MIDHSLSSMSPAIRPTSHWRQTANLILAVTQTAAIVWASTTGAALDSGSRAGFESPVFPADYTFAVWLVIYPGALVYGFYQFLPTQSSNPLLVRTGWWTAAAFGALTLWPVFQALGWLWLTVVCIFVMFTALLGAFNSWTTHGPRTTADKYLAVLPLSIFFGYITAATVLTIALVVPRIDVSGLIASAVTPWAVTILLGAGLFAAFLTLRSGGNVGYALTVIWSFFGIVVQNVVNVPNVAVAATAGGMALLVALALLRGRIRRVVSTL